jgi:hypothetical protein
MRHISYARGKGKLRHNNREMISPNVDRSRIGDNITLKRQSLADAYEEIFGGAMAEYNAKQRRSDRKIADYFEKLFGTKADTMRADTVIKNDNKQQSFYEYVVGVGTMQDTGYASSPEAAKVAVECLREYMAGFGERNPQFHVFNAVIHQDEATPHLHYDMIPYADGMKKGMTRQQGLNKALEQMGYGTGKQAIANFTQSEREVFRKICEAHGIEIAEETKGRGHTYTCEEYRQTAEKNRQEIAEQEVTKSKNQAEIETQNQKIADKKTQAESMVAAFTPAPTKTEKNIFGKEKIVEKSEAEIQLEKQMAAAKIVLSDKASVDKDKAKVERDQQQIVAERRALSQREESLHQREQQLAKQQQKMAWTAKSQARYEAEKLLAGGGYVRKINPDQQRLMQSQMHSQTAREQLQQAHNADYEIER